MQAAPDGGTINVYTVILSFIAFMSLIGPGIVAYLQTQANRAAADRETARKEREVNAAAEAAAAAVLAAERDAKAVAAAADIHKATNSQLSKLQADLADSRAETKAALDKTMELLSEKAAVATTPAAPTPAAPEPERLTGPIAVYTVEGSKVEIGAKEPVPVVVSDPTAEQEG